MNEKYKKMLSFKTKKEATESVRKLRKEFDSARTEDKKFRIFKVTLMAGKRAKSIIEGKKSMTAIQKNEYREIGKIYKKASDQFGMRMSPMTPKYAKMRYREYEKYKG